MRHIRKNDIVVLRKDITACRGSDEPHEQSEGGLPRSRWATGKGDRGRVLAVYPERGKVIVEGVNYRYKHIRPDQQNPRGGRLQKESVIDISNVQPYCEKCDDGVRVRIGRNEAGRRVRVCSVCGEAIGTA